METGYGLEQKAASANGSIDSSVEVLIQAWHEGSRLLLEVEAVNQLWAGDSLDNTKYCGPLMCNL